MLLNELVCSGNFGNTVGIFATMNVHIVAARTRYAKLLPGWASLPLAFGYMHAS
jgi:hypothetical protein